MTEITWTVIAELPGLPQAELLASMLAANGVEGSLSHEGYAHTRGLTVGPLSRVQILVPSDNLEAAQQIVAEYFAAFQTDSPSGEPAGELDEESGDSDAADLDGSGLS